MDLADFGDFKACTLSACLHGCCYFIAFDLLGGGIPLDLTSKPSGDCRQVAEVHGLQVGVNIRDWQTTFADAAIEVGFVAFVRLAFVESLHLLIARDIFIPLLFDRFAGDTFAVDEDPAFGTFDEQSIIATARDMDLHAIGELVHDVKVMGGVEAIVGKRIAILHVHRMFAIGTIDFDWAGSLLGHLGCPQSDIDVVGTPVGELTAGVFVPPTEVVVATLLDVIHFGCLAEPHVPIEVSRCGGFGKRPTCWATVDAAGDLLDVTQETLVSHVHCAHEESSVGALLRTDKKDELRVGFASGSDRKIFSQSKR